MKANPRMPNYILHLYVTGQSPRSRHAAANLRRICEHHLHASYELVLIDVLARPDLAEAAHILATPTTVRVAPLPAYRVIGDLSDSSKVMMTLGLEHAESDIVSEEEMS